MGKDTSKFKITEQSPKHQFKPIDMVLLFNQGDIAILFSKNLLIKQIWSYSKVPKQCDDYPHHSSMIMA